MLGCLLPQDPATFVNAVDSPSLMKCRDNFFFLLFCIVMLISTYSKSTWLIMSSLAQLFTGIFPNGREVSSKALPLGASEPPETACRMKGGGESIIEGEESRKITSFLHRLSLQPLSYLVWSLNEVLCSKVGKGCHSTFPQWNWEKNPISFSR